MADLENSTELLKQALDELKTSATLSSATLLKLGKAANVLNKDLKESQKAIEDETDQRLTLSKTLKSFAKDMGSAAVLLSLLLCAGTWVAAIIHRNS